MVLGSARMWAVSNSVPLGKTSLESWHFEQTWRRWGRKASWSRRWAFQAEGRVICNPWRDVRSGHQGTSKGVRVATAERRMWGCKEVRSERQKETCTVGLCRSLKVLGILLNHDQSIICNLIIGKALLTYLSLIKFELILRDWETRQVLLNHFERWRFRLRKYWMNYQLLREWFDLMSPHFWGFPIGSVGKESTCNTGDAGDAGLIPGLRRSPGRGHDNPHQYYCLDNPMNRGAWWAIVYRIAESEATEHSDTPHF